MKIVLTKRQSNILENISAQAGVENRLRIKRLLLGATKMDDIGPLCGLINDEYLTHGIDLNWEANDYGKELAALLNLINRPRLTQ